MFKFEEGICINSGESRVALLRFLGRTSTSRSKVTKLGAIPLLLIIVNMSVNLCFMYIHPQDYVRKQFELFS